MNSITQLDRLRGCLFGGALGDTIGLFTEFLSAEQSRELYGTQPVFTLVPRPAKAQTSSQAAKQNLKWCHMDRHRALFEPSAWTDDTDQALLILLSFLRSGGKELDAKDFANRLRFWVANGLRALGRPPLGIGRTVGGVVRSKDYLDDPFAAARERWEATDRNLAANGAVMRTGVVGALVFQTLDGIAGYDRTFKAAIDIAATTHADPRCLVSCAIVSGLICAIMNGELHTENALRSIVDNSITFLHAQYPDSKLSPEQREELDRYIWAPTIASLQLDERSAIGYTYKALGAGVWALREAMLLHPFTASSATPATPAQLSPHPSEVFVRLITQLTMAGGDSDTNCAVAGPLIGAWYGYRNLPVEWTRELKHREWLLAKADAAGSLLGLPSEPEELPLEAGSKTGVDLVDFGLEELPQVPAVVPTYDWEADQDTLFDAGKGAMSKEEIDAMWKVLIEDMHTRLGQTIPDALKPKGKSSDDCLIC